MGCNTSQEQPQSTLNVNNTDADNVDDGNGVKQSLDGPTVPSSTPSDKKNSTEVANENAAAAVSKGKESEESSSSRSPPKDRSEDKSPVGEMTPQDPNEEEDEEKAAVKIQAAFRGHKVRTEMKKGDAPEDSKTKQKEQQKETPAAIKLDEVAQELDNIFDPNDKELCDAATKIQATFRGHLQRKLVTGAKDQVDIDEITKKVAEELDIDLTDPELNKAATKIQASFRGHKTRKGAPN